MKYCTLFALGVILAIPLTSTAGELQFREQELPERLMVGYAVRLTDMNDDRRLDILVVDSKRIVWLESPNWTVHTLISHDQEFDNVCIAPADIDGDGRLDFAVGSDWQFGNTDSGGSIGWIRRGVGSNDPWHYYSIHQEPTTHRMQFADIDNDDQMELVVAPLKGRNTTAPDFAENGVRLLSFEIPADPVKGPWKPMVITDQLHVMHNFWPTDWDNDGDMDLLAASFEGVTLLERDKTDNWTATRIGAGNRTSLPNQGASEIKRGRLAKGGDYIATIEPWHGHEVVVYTKPAEPRPPKGGWLWDRQVLDDDLKWGHAVWCANLDGDEEEELIIGVRDDKTETAQRGLRIYDPQNEAGTKWKRYVIDPGSVAIEDLAAGDLNGDGRADIVAVGRQTHNIKIYWNETE